MAEKQQTFRLTLTTKHPDAVIRLRRLLKIALRAFGFRCLEVRQTPKETPSDE